MKRSIFFFLLFNCSFFFYSCKDDVEQPAGEINLDCLYDKLDHATNLLDTAAIDKGEGSYPLENARDLQLLVDSLQLGISKGLAGHFIFQSEADGFCTEAQKRIESFLSSYLPPVSVGQPAELIVYGIDRQGRIEFGDDPAFAGGDAFTVESWMKYDRDFFNNGIGNFLSTFDGSTQPIEGWMINFMDKNLRSTIGMGPQHGRVLESGDAYPENYGEWNHVVMVYDENLSEGQLKMYLNGELFFSKTNDVFNQDGELQQYQPNTKNLNMWAFQEPTDLNRCMTGYIKKFRFWNTAKTIQEINNLMTSDVSGKESDLVCAWDFTIVPADDQNIPDLTGRHTAKIVGLYKWIPKN